MSHSLCDPLQMVHRLFEGCKGGNAQPQRILFGSHIVIYWSIGFYLLRILSITTGI